MEEDITKSGDDGCWTFVDRMSSAFDSSDEGSEDSGSSIVVINSSESEHCYTNGEERNASEAIPASLLESTEEFVKERSPFEEVEHPEINTEEGVQNVVSEDETEDVGNTLSISEDIEKSTQDNEDNPVVDDEGEQEDEETLPVFEPVVQLQCANVDDKIDFLDGFQQRRGSAEVKEEILDDIRTEEEVVSPPESSEKSAEEEAYENECFEGEGEDWSVEDRSVDEVWDVSTNSMASSIISVPPEGQLPDEQLPRRPAKPDLLEEANRMEEMDQLDYSTMTNQDLPAELNVANIFRERHYVHRPNQQLNVQLSYVVAFAVAAVVGFALGHVVGLADNFPSRCPAVTNTPMTETTNMDDVHNTIDWRSEVQRLTAVNEQLQTALDTLRKNLPGDVNSNTCHSDLHVNDLLSENSDLKQSIGRIRYGKPVRSLEDRDTINRLMTENEDLKAVVGKLRYKCNFQQKETASDKETKPEVEAGPFWKTLDAMNLTDEWASLTDSKFVNEQLEGLKEYVADLINLIGLRKDELMNMSKENGNRIGGMMESMLETSAEKIGDLMERIYNHRESVSALAADVANRLVDVRLKLESQWKSFQSGDRVEQESSPPEEKSLNADWFLAMGQQREKVRRTERQTQWLFERAKNREQERRSNRAKLHSKNNKHQKMFQGHSWNQYST